VPMPTATRASGYSAASACEDAGAATRFPCTTPLTRLFDRSGAVELRGLAVVDAIGERAEGDWGRFLCARFANLLLVMRALMTRVCSQFGVFRLLARQKRGIYDG
jgi:hypothetical protein